jgi:hypothetical protein
VRSLSSNWRKGVDIGPDLNRAGRRRSAAYLQASVLTPDADLTPGYATRKHGVDVTTEM